MNDNENNMDELPKGWAWARIDELIGNDGCFCDGDWVETKDQDPEGDVRLIQLADIGDSVFRNRSNRFLTVDKAVELGCTFLERDDVLIARMPDPLGRACVFPEDSKRCVTVVDVCIVRPGLGGVEPGWLAYTVNASAIRSAIAALQSGSTRKRISRSNLAKIPLPVPPLSEQHRIVAKIEELFVRLEAGVEALKRTKTLLKRYRQSVLKAAVEGRLTQEWREAHKDELEPASKLLERISQEWRRKCVEKVKEGLRSYLRSVVARSGVEVNPREALRDFLTEMVVNDVDLSHGRLLDRIAANFLELMGGVQELKEQIRSYLLWLRGSLDALAAEGLASDILMSQWEAWQRYVEKEKNRKGPRREIVAIFGVGGGMMDAFSQWLTGESLRDHGAAHLRRTLIEEPAERNWKADEAKWKANQRDTTQLPELPEGWVWVTVEQLSWDAGYGTSVKCDYDYSGPPVLRIPNIVGGRIDLSDLKHASSDVAFDEKEAIRPGDLLIIRTNGSKNLIGRAAVIPPDTNGSYWFASYLIRYRLFAIDALPLWVVQFWNSPTMRGRIEGIAATSAGQYNVSMTALSKLPIALPPAPEQSQIVAELDRRLSIADEVEATVDANLKRAERLRQSILKQAFEGKLVPQDPDDEPASVLLERIREEKAEREAERVIAKRKPSGGKKKGKSVAKAPPQLSLPTE